MKKKIFLSLLIMAALCFVPSCSDDDKDNPDIDSTEDSTGDSTGDGTEDGSTTPSGPNYSTDIAGTYNGYVNVAVPDRDYTKTFGNASVRIDSNTDGTCDLTFTCASCGTVTRSKAEIELSDDGTTYTIVSGAADDLVDDNGKGWEVTDFSGTVTEDGDAVFNITTLDLADGVTYAFTTEEPSAIELITGYYAGTVSLKATVLKLIPLTATGEYDVFCGKDSMGGTNLVLAVDGMYVEALGYQIVFKNFDLTGLITTKNDDGSFTIDGSGFTTYFSYTFNGDDDSLFIKGDLSAEIDTEGNMTLEFTFDELTVDGFTIDISGAFEGETKVYNPEHDMIW